MQYQSNTPYLVSFFDSNYANKISYLSGHNLSMNTDLVEATWPLVHVFLTMRPQKLLKWKISRWEFSDLLFRFVPLVLLFSFNYGTLVDIKLFLTWKLVLQLKSKDFPRKYSRAKNLSYQKNFKYPLFSLFLKYKTL